MKRDLLDNPNGTRIDEWGDWREREGYKGGLIIGLFLGILVTFIIMTVLCLIYFGAP